ncbi:MAG TPA: hypothetical protein VIV12_08685 [Streptosporangiaceae bacterium]
MAWSTPTTFVSGNALTAAQMNIISGNLNETAPAKATTAGGYFVATGSNAIAERVGDEQIITTSQTTTSTSFTDLTTVGPELTVTTATRALVVVTAQCSNDTSTNSCRMSWAASGATTLAANDNRCLMLSGTGDTIAGSFVTMYTSFTAGSNVITAKYRVSGGTGTWLNRRLLVLPY